MHHSWWIGFFFLAALAYGAPEAPEYFDASTAESQTLPAEVWRFRLVNKIIQGDYGYDARGQRESLGFEVQAVATAVAVEYGLTDRLSLGLILPYVTSNQA